MIPAVTVCIPMKGTVMQIALPLGKVARRAAVPVFATGVLTVAAVPAMATFAAGAAPAATVAVHHTGEGWTDNHVLAMSYDGCPTMSYDGCH